jgi:hypothetical protein
MTKPVWFVDVDGVINVLVDYVNKPHLDSCSDWETIDVNGYTIVFSPTLVESVNALSETIDIVFLTTWVESAVNNLAPALGLNIKNFLRSDGSNSSFEYQGNDASKRWWKLNGILDHINNDHRPFVWVDDDMSNEVKRAILGRAAFEGVENLLITPNSKIGLTEQHIGIIEAFTSRVSQPVLNS